jgi:hypothetical protein
VSERLALFASHRLAEPSREWAAVVRERSPDKDPDDLAHDLLVESASIARTEGA